MCVGNAQFRPYALSVNYRLQGFMSELGATSHTTIAAQKTMAAFLRRQGDINQAEEIEDCVQAAKGSLAYLGYICT